MQPTTRVLICRLCDNSQQVSTRETPERCPICREPAHWRVAEPGEITASDKRFLKSIRIGID